MTPIFELPSEILWDVFSLAVQKFPLIFKTKNSFHDCVALIDISRVCRRWREVALTDSSLWSTIYILLDSPTARTLDQATYFASICFARSKDLLLTCAISISNLDELRLARPLVQTLISHEDRWSQIAINLTPSTQPFGYAKMSEIEASGGTTEEQDLLLKYAGSSHLKEFQSNLAPWFTCSLHSPLPALSILRIACLMLVGCVPALADWLPRAPILQELEVTHGYDRFAMHVWDQARIAAAREAQVPTKFVLSALRTLNIPVPLIPFFTCPALETYVIQPISSDYLVRYLEFIERSGAPPSFRTIKIRNSDLFLVMPSVRGYFLPTITNLLIKSPGEPFFTMFSERSQEDGVVGFSVLPGLEHLEIADCEDINLPFLSSLITSRWDIGVPHRTLISVKLDRCFASSPVPDLLLSPPTDGIDLTQVGDNWREIARCVNEGLSLFACKL